MSASGNRKRKVVGFKKGFKIATEVQKLKAITAKGEKVEDIPPELFPFPGFFPEISEPTHEDDWLAQYLDGDQSFQNWLQYFGKERTPRPDQVVYLRVIGEMEHSDEFSLKLIKKFVKLYYPGIKVKCLPAWAIEGEGAHDLHISYEQINKRLKSLGPTKKRAQLYTRVAHPWYIEKAHAGSRQISVNILLKILDEAKPQDAFCVIGVTTEDLFEGRDDVFAVGMAAGGSGVGVFSFARYDPTFGKPKKKKTTTDKALMLERSCKVVVHELAHIFGMDHCTFYTCCMNGSGHLEEDFRQPIHFCPVDLRKLQRVTGCNLIDRYEGLLKFYEEHHFDADAEWTRKLLRKIKQEKGMDDSNNNNNSSNNSGSSSNNNNVEIGNDTDGSNNNNNNNNNNNKANNNSNNGLKKRKSTQSNKTNSSSARSVSSRRKATKKEADVIDLTDNDSDNDSNNGVSASDSQDQTKKRRKTAKSTRTSNN